MTIQQTDNYDWFQFITGNRVVSRRKVDRIKNDVNNGLNLFPYCPIIVNRSEDDKFLIIDGQHRFVASKELEHPIHYVVAHNIPLRDVARMNNNTDKWSNNDFLDCYIRLGIEDYQVLRDFLKSHKVSLRQGIGLLATGKVAGGGHLSARFKDGEFRVKHLEAAKELIELVDHLFGIYVFSRDNKLIEAVRRLHKANRWDLEVMKDKLKKHRHMMEKQSSVKTYMYLIEQIYNVQNRGRKPIM